MATCALWALCRLHKQQIPRFVWSSVSLQWGNIVAQTSPQTTACSVPGCKWFSTLQRDSGFAQSSLSTEQQRQPELTIQRCLTTSSPTASHASQQMRSQAQEDPPELELYVTESKEKCEDFVLGKGKPPEAPITCCMSGCPKCVWIQYGEDLVNYYSDGGATAIKEIEKMDDPFLKAFVLAEVKAALDSK